MLGGISRDKKPRVAVTRDLNPPVIQYTQSRVQDVRERDPPELLQPFLVGPRAINITVVYKVQAAINIQGPPPLQGGSSRWGGPVL